MRCQHKLPYQIFPGIFSSIDSYSKKITNIHFAQHRQMPNWFSMFGPIEKLVKVPHLSKFYVVDPETNILLRGTPDEMLHKSDGSYVIIDYKTAKITDTQDKLLPMYEAQLNAYAYIAERVGFKPVTGLSLIYYEPITDISSNDIDSHMLNDGFSMNFTEKLVPVSLEPDNIKSLLNRVREIYDLSEKPKGIQGCKDCESLDNLLSVAGYDVKPLSGNE